METYGTFMLFGITNGKPIKLQLVRRTVLIFDHMLCGVQSTKNFSFRIPTNPSVPCFFSLSLSLTPLRWHLVLLRLTSHFTLDLIFAKGMVASGFAQRFDLFILTCLRTVFRRATIGRIPWTSDQPVAETFTWQHITLTTDRQTNRQTSMPPVGFEPTISAGERPKTYALDRAATERGSIPCVRFVFFARSQWQDGRKRSLTLRCLSTCSTPDDSERGCVEFRVGKLYYVGAFNFA